MFLIDEVELAHNLQDRPSRSGHAGVCSSLYARPREPPDYGLGNVPRMKTALGDEL